MRFAYISKNIIRVCRSSCTCLFKSAVALLFALFLLGVVSFGNSNLKTTVPGDQPAGVGPGEQNSQRHLSYP